MSDIEHRPSLTNRRLWQKRRAHYLAVFDKALQLLQRHDKLPISEKSLVRKLYFTTITARLELDPKGRFHAPRFEAQNLPDPDSDEINDYEEKRPDIQWVHDDPDARDIRYCEKSFVIECKCLGKTRSSGWNLNSQYVTAGILRFLSEKCRYGNHMAEGMMIGFIQNMELKKIHATINDDLHERDIPILNLHDSWKERGISKLSHDLQRPFKQSPFLLTHLWIDLRSND